MRRTAQQEAVEEESVRRCVAKEGARRREVRELKQTPEFISTEELSVKWRRLYHTAIYNLVGREVMEVVGETRATKSDKVSGISLQSRRESREWR
ncbi:MAG: hypothetical protein JW732_04960 [Dehalococcoidia bacterium]|nr:hypothetical protein [Dehalococcoidia bacterium]